MLISYNLLKTYFEKEIPAPEKAAELFTFHSFEVEGMEKIPRLADSPLPLKKGDYTDTILDLKILPDRAHYCLCHKGVAGELSAITGIPLKPHEYRKLKISEVGKLEIKIADSSLCRRYVGRRIENIKVAPSPKWLKDFLEAVGMRSINNIVDATNFIMIDVGQPLHAFDADKVKGGIVVRSAKKDERITTLDGKEVALDEKCLVIADEAGALSIAGIKGGNRAEVDEKTKNIILESANFHPSETRKTANRIGILTEASKRFENEISPELAIEGMIKLTELISDVSAETQTYADLTQTDAEKIRIGEITNVYPTKFPKTEIVVSAKEISEILGVEISEKEIMEILERMNIKAEKQKENLKLQIPFERLDLKIPEDIAEEVGRIYGYDKVVEKLPAKSEKAPEINREYEIACAARFLLAESGFSEIYGYSFKDKGDLEVMSPLASDKGFLRTDLAGEMSEKLKFNLKSNLFDKEPVKLFEVGNVFRKDGEFKNCAIGVAFKTKKFGDAKKEILDVMAKILGEFGIEEKAEKFAEVPEANFSAEGTSAVLEFDFRKFAALAKKIPKTDLSEFLAGDIRYQKISAYPRVVRDIAFFVDAKVSEADASKIISKSADTDLLAIGPVLFDVFEKNGKKSLAFRMVFQSYEKTLSDGEVNKVMEKIYRAIKKEGWEVR